MATPSPLQPAVSAPLVDLPGTLAAPALAPLYVDGIPAGLVSPPISSPGQGNPVSQRFWSSEVRALGSPYHEQIVVSLSAPKLINYISFDLPHFPHRLRVYWKNSSGDWEQLKGPNGNDLLYVITGSVPAIVNNPAALAAGLNPYHYGAGHWIHFDEMIEPVRTSQLLFSALRSFYPIPGQPPGTYPVNPQGKLSPYPLGLANCDFGYRALSKDHIPWTGRSPTIITERESFTTSYDVNGSPVTLSARENRASDLLLGVPWKSAPQARSDAVVSLYVDSRDSMGKPQVIDRFYLQPITSGCNLNLYYATDPPPANTGFQAVDTPMIFPLSSAAGQILPVADDEGLVFADQPGWIDISSQAAGAQAGQPWWAAIEIMPQFSSEDTGNYLIADGSIIQLSYQDGFWIIEAGGGVLAQWEFPFSKNDKLQFAIGYDGSLVAAWSPKAGMSIVAAGPDVPATAVIRFGAVQGVAGNELGIWPGNYRLTSFVLKQEPLDFTSGIPGSFTSFAADAPAYVAPADGPGDTTINALVRFSPSFVLGAVPDGLNPYGFVGGPGSSYSMCTWTPVLGDYKLAAGYLNFDPVRASVFKFQFTSLQPMPYQFFDATPQKVQMFPSTPQAQPEKDVDLDTGLSVNQSLAPAITYADSPQPQNPLAPGAALPTEALYATDASAAETMVAQGGSLYNFQPWLPTSPPMIPAPQKTGVHAYQEIDVTQHSSVAYFVSLAAINMYRTDYTAAEDTAEYTETFDDTAWIDPASLVITSSNAPVIPWDWSPGMLTVPQGLIAGSFSRVSSITFSSAHAVRGIQFAATQSAPIQLLADPDFSVITSTGEPAWWTATGDTLPLQVTDNINAALGNMVTVQRLPTQNTWASLMSAFSTWTDLEAANDTWYAVEGPAETSAYGGLAYSGAPVEVTAAGRVYAAARVFAPAGLSQPLLLQLIDGETGSVLAEAEQTVSAGVVTEWWVGYTIGAGGQASTLSWSAVQGEFPSWAATAGDSWNDVDTTIAPLGATISAQLIQQGITSDVWYTDNLSVFEDSIVWEFSNDGGTTWWAAYDIRNNPDGVLLFPPPAKGNGTELSWRVSGYRPNLSVSSLAIRPWYGTAPMGIRPRAAGIGHGPEVSPLNRYPDIHSDPRWRMWDKPIPQDWYFAYQQLLFGQTAYVTILAPPAAAPNLVLGNALVIIPPPPVTSSPETYSDIYADAYTEYYGIIDGSDIYTDEFGNDTYYSNGTPGVIGSSTFTVQVTDSEGRNASQQLTIPVEELWEPAYSAQ